jgi:DNA-binding CsgD family transcriptional regulator
MRKVVLLAAILSTAGWTSAVERQDWADAYRPRTFEGSSELAPSDRPISASETPLMFWGTLVFAGLSWAWVLRTKNRDAVISWAHGVRKAEWQKGAWEEWEGLKLARTVQVEPTSNLPHPDWNLLSPSEREVAILFSQGMTVEHIASKLRCTRPHIYNLRSSIRQKWGMDKSEDLNLRIRSYVKGSN